MFEQNIFDDLTRKSSSAEGATFHSILNVLFNMMYR